MLRKLLHAFHSSHALFFRQGRTHRLVLSVAAILAISSVLVRDVSASPLPADVNVDDISDAGDKCREDCHRQYLQDSLACGQEAQSCLENIIYAPWSFWIPLQSICHSNQSICDSNAGITAARCKIDCSKMVIDLLNGKAEAVAIAE